MKLVEIKNNQPVTTSLQVAENFNKQHKDVLQAYDNLINTGVAEKSADLFWEDIYIHPQNKQEYRMIYMNRDGFSLLAMGFTGKKALSFKLQYIEQFNQMEEHIKSGKQHVSIDSETKRMNAEARLKNANSRQAKLLAELANDATTEVNKALLQDKAVESLIGEKLLEMPVLKSKLYDSSQIAKRLGILSKKRKPHGTAVNQIIQENIAISEDEFEILPGTKNGWSGSVTKYAESVIDRVESWIKDNNYPSVIAGENQNYYVVYEDIE